MGQEDSIKISLRGCDIVSNRIPEFKKVEVQTHVEVALITNFK